MAAKVHALKKAKIPAPKLTVVDYQGPAAHWAGVLKKYTDGSQALSGSPLKDVGFPYGSQVWDGLGLPPVEGATSRDSAVDYAMLDFSWQAYLIASRRGPHNRFADWVDRGAIPPTLKEWANYLEWVITKSKCGVDRREVKRISVSDGEWDLTMDKGDNIRGTGLVITGPGPIRHLPGYDPKSHPPAATDAENFWSHLEGVTNVPPNKVFAIIGSGGAAASVALALLQNVRSDFRLEILTPDGVIYSRGESYDENRHYSDPDAWRSFDDKSKKKFNEHTSAGVFALDAKRALSSAYNLETRSADVEGIKVWKKTGGVSVYLKSGVTRHYERVIIAWGFDGLWWTPLLDSSLLGRLPMTDRGEVDLREIKSGIGENLELRNFDPPLHLPMLAEMEGPGFPSLMSLGLLSDRILMPYAR
ncbi:SidA/IucD/PvdA family monooxygenase [Streptomyces sp. CB02959]|uniref:SidA/IucD/PvdA family monooxygenase n=1 Tax=Streptomyces sp. CB02959 TaxID=2020330 RepID=UPI0015E10E9A|nr:SidA/IucD/PvdA family monooxygenase [Streptomyces sp. CB02959]